MFGKKVTAGEQLCQHLYDTLIPGAEEWNRLSEPLASTGYPGDLLVFFRQMTAVNLSCRIVRAGTSLSQSLDVRSKGFLSRMEDLLRLFDVPGTKVDAIARQATRATLAAMKDIPSGLRNSERQRCAANNIGCYLCGVSLTANPGYTAFSLDHVWPQACGGDSIIENLLPCCSSCNAAKEDFAGWTMPPVQSFFRGLNADEQTLRETPKQIKYAVHFREAQAIAERRGLSLKDAFLRLGPWRDPLRLLNEQDSAHFFNVGFASGRE